MGAIRSFFVFFRPYYKSSLLLAIVLLLTSGLTVVSPFLYQILVDRGINQGSLRTVLWMVALIASSLVLQELLTLGQATITLRMREGVFAQLKQRLYRHLMGLPSSYFAERHKGRLLSLLTSDVNVLQNLFLDRMVFFLRNALVGISILVILLTIQKTMVLMALVFVPLLVFLYILFRKKINTLSGINQERQAALMEQLQEDLAVVKAVQAFSVVNERTRRTVPFIKQAESARRKLDMQYYRASSSTIVLNLIGLVIIWGFGAREVIAERMTMGTLIAISFFFNYIINLFYSAYYTLMNVQGAIPSAKRILETLGTTAAIADKPDAVDKDFSGAMIVMDHVRFAYTPGQPVLKDVNLVIRPGDVLGIIGGSGQGKTTLANLLLRIIDPEEGAVSMNGIDLRDIRLDTLRRTVAVIPQEDLLLNDTLRANIIFHRTGISEAQLRRACERAKVSDFADRLEDGYDTVVGEHGTRLSGGQRKRIAIARALLDDPYVLILDEATTMLDEETERDILATIVTDIQDKIVLMITHKESNLAFANRVVRVENGTVVPCR